MTPTDGGKAYATISGFRWYGVPGVNVGCMMDLDQYDVQLIQNSSINVPMTHESQTDTMVLDLGYITNTGSYYVYMNIMILEA